MVDQLDVNELNNPDVEALLHKIGMKTISFENLGEVTTKLTMLMMKEKEDIEENQKEAISKEN